MAGRRVHCQELTVGVFLLAVRQHLGVESQWSPGTIQELLQNSNQVGVGGIYGQRDGIPGTRVNQLGNRG